MKSSESPESAGPGIAFTETMRGFGSTTSTADYETAFRQGERDHSIIEFTVTVTAPNLDRLIADPAHEAVLTGTVTAPALSPTPLRVEAGRFHLLVRDTDAPRTRKMVYQMPLVADDGRRFHFEGFKTIHDDAGPDIWADTTTLFVTIHHDNEGGSVAAKGIIKIHINDFRKQLGTMKVLGSSW